MAGSTGHSLGNCHHPLFKQHFRKQRFCVNGKLDAWPSGPLVDDV